MYRACSSAVEYLDMLSRGRWFELVFGPLKQCSITSISRSCSTRNGFVLSVPIPRILGNRYVGTERFPKLSQISLKKFKSWQHPFEMFAFLCCSNDSSWNTRFNLFASSVWYCANNSHDTGVDVSGSDDQQTTFHFVSWTSSSLFFKTLEGSQYSTRITCC